LATASPSPTATWLQDGGYHAGLFGKYLNGYGNEYVPPGWDRWFATYGGGAYFDFAAVSDGVEEHYARFPMISLRAGRAREARPR